MGWPGGRVESPPQREILAYRHTRSGYLIHRLPCDANGARWVVRDESHALVGYTPTREAVARLALANMPEDRARTLQALEPQDFR